MARFLIRSSVGLHERSCSGVPTVVLRQIERILIFALHSTPHEATTIDEAIRFVSSYQDDGRPKPIDRYEIQIRYNNGDQVCGSFGDKEGALAFLRAYQAEK